MAEESLHSRIFGEVNKIVNIEPKRERGADNEALVGSSGSTRQPVKRHVSSRDPLSPIGFRMALILS